jgi:hypothetical protein
MSISIILLGLTFVTGSNAMDVDIEHYGCKVNGNDTSLCTKGFAAALSDVSAAEGGNHSCPWAWTLHHRWHRDEERRGLGCPRWG